MAKDRDRLVHSELVGTILDVFVDIGDEVVIGVDLALMESMKMEIPIRSEHAGVVVAVHAFPGLVVQADECLFAVQQVEDSACLQSAPPSETFPAWC